MDAAFRLTPDARRLPATWLLLALSALAISTLCALLLVAARAPLPLFSAPELFGRALVLHVSLAIVVWFLACASAFWTLAAQSAGPVFGFWRWSGAALSVAGVGAMVAALFAAEAAPLLANYIPVLQHPLFLTGLAAFAIGVALSGLVNLRAAAAGWRNASLPLWRLGAVLSILAFGMACGALLASAAALAGQPLDARGMDLLAWGPGHVLQFVYVLLMMSAWAVLAEAVTDHAPAATGWRRALFIGAALPLLAVPVLYGLHPVDGQAFRRAFTLLMAFGSWPAAAAFGASLAWQVLRDARARRHPLALALLLSILLFFIGCGLGALIRGDTTLVPAHYHGTVGAVTLALMALGYRLLPAFGLPLAAGRMLRWQPILYGGGLALLALALAWSGLIGVPRKTLHVQVLLQHPAYLVAMGAAGIGGALAVSGAALFVANVLRALWRNRFPLPLTQGRTPLLARVFPARGTGKRRDVRLPALAATLLLTLASGLLIQHWPSGPTLVPPSAAERELQQRFSLAAQLLAARHYQEAVDALHALMLQAPQMPEVHVNMGYALLGLEKHERARDFFATAIELRSTQMNAYYGLAVALEGMGDLPGAVAAMHAYVHRSAPDDPFVRKAEAAIWEWQDQLGRARLAAAAVPEHGNGAHGAPKGGKGWE